MEHVEMMYILPTPTKQPTFLEIGFDSVYFSLFFIIFFCGVSRIKFPKVRDLVFSVSVPTLTRALPPTWSTTRSAARASASSPASPTPPPSGRGVFFFNWAAIRCGYSASECTVDTSVGRAWVPTITHLRHLHPRFWLTPKKIPILWMVLRFSGK